MFEYITKHFVLVFTFLKCLGIILPLGVWCVTKLRAWLSLWGQSFKFRYYREVICIWKITRSPDITTTITLHGWDKSCKTVYILMSLDENEYACTEMNKDAFFFRQHEETCRIYLHCTYFESENGSKFIF